MCNSPSFFIAIICLCSFVKISFVPSLKMSGFNYAEPGAILIRPTNNNLVQSVLQQPETEKWTPQDYNYSCSYQPSVPKDSNEFKTISKLFYDTSKGLKLQKIKRVQNPYLMGEYLLTKEAKMARNGSVRTQLLFHGTKRASIKDIVRDGFDWRLHGENRGTRFGNGVNFTPRAGFADNFGNQGRYRTMIVAHVLIENECVGHEGLVLPPDGYDTAIKPGGNVFVKFEDGEFYPSYILQYYKPVNVK